MFDRSVMNLLFLSCCASMFATTLLSDGVRADDHTCGFKRKNCGKDTANMGSRYYAGEFLCSSNEDWQFGIKEDSGNLVLCEDNVLVWSAGTGDGRTKNNYFLHKSNGNLVVYGTHKSNGKKITLWESDTSGHTKSEFSVGNNGVARLSDNNGESLWQTKGEAGGGGGGGSGACSFKSSDCAGSSVPLKARFTAGEHLCRGNYRFGPNQAGTQLVLCKGNGLVWAHPAETPYLILKANGNLMLYSKGDDDDVWSTDTKDKGVRSLQLKSNGNVVLVKSNGNTVWSIQDESSDSSSSEEDYDDYADYDDESSEEEEDFDNVVTAPLDIKEANRKHGFFNVKTDICRTDNDGKCPCYPDDDDWYCPDDWLPWKMQDVNKANDKLYGRCDPKRIPTCGRGEMLCPMRKPRLDRFYDEKKRDPYYFIDYDCIQCVPTSENCSKCSPGLYCTPLGRCVGPSLVQWCKRTYGDLVE